MKNNQGFTLMELMVVIAIVAIAVALAVPSFRDLIERKAVSGAAEAAYEQLLLARSEALKRSKPIWVDFNVTGDANWAIATTDKPGGCNAEETDTSSADFCSVDFKNDGGTQLVSMRIFGSDYKNIILQQPFGASFVTPGAAAGICSTNAGNDQQTCFNFVQGLAKQGHVQFSSANYSLRVQVGILGNVRVCVPVGPTFKDIPGYGRCT